MVTEFVFNFVWAKIIWGEIIGALFHFQFVILLLHLFVIKNINSFLKLG